MVSFLKKGILVSLFMLCVFFAGPAFGAVTGITIDLQNLGLEIGQTGTLVATVIAEDADDKTFTWASDHPEIATINQNGQVTAFKTGGAESQQPRTPEVLLPPLMYRSVLLRFL